MEGFFNHILTLTKLLEIVAALAVTITYFNLNKLNKEKNLLLKLLVIYLWGIVFIEIFGGYTFFIKPYHLEEIAFFKSYPEFEKNYWLFNSYSLIAYIFYTWYFLKQLTFKKNLNIIRYATLLFFVLSIINFMTTDIFFTGYSKFMNLIGLILIVVTLFMYYYEILNSDRILSISNSLPFYLSIGVLIFYISVTPLFLSSQYIKTEEIVFTKYYALILSYANYFLYGMIIFGIVRCYWFNKSQNTKFSSSPTLS